MIRCCSHLRALNHNQYKPNNSFKPNLLRGPAHAVTCTTPPYRYAGRLNSGVRPHKSGLPRDEKNTTVDCMRALLLQHPIKPLCREQSTNGNCSRLRHCGCIHRRSGILWNNSHGAIFSAQRERVLRCPGCWPEYQLGRI